MEDYDSELMSRAPSRRLTLSLPSCGTASQEEVSPTASRRRLCRPGAVKLATMATPLTGPQAAMPRV